MHCMIVEDSIQLCQHVVNFYKNLVRQVADWEGIDQRVIKLEPKVGLCEEGLVVGCDNF